MDWVGVESRALAAVTYDDAKHHLYVRFRSGKLYRYSDFPRHQYDGLLAAESKGTYFAEQIRGKFLYEEVGEPRFGPRLVYSSGK